MVNVLVVDDEEEICDFLKEVLEKMDLDVQTAISGDQALQLLEKKEWNLLIVDLKLSTRITGLDVIKAMRTKWPKVIVMAMSGYVDVSLKQETEKLGISCYLDKPTDIQPEKLCDRVKALLSL